MSSQRYQEFIAERARLLERIKELEAENAELRKRLGEPVATVSSASCAMKNLSPIGTLSSTGNKLHGIIDIALMQSCISIMR